MQTNTFDRRREYTADLSYKQRHWTIKVSLIHLSVAKATALTLPENLQFTLQELVKADGHRKKRQTKFLKEVE